MLGARAGLVFMKLIFAKKKKTFRKIIFLKFLQLYYTSTICARWPCIAIGYHHHLNYNY